MRHVFIFIFLFIILAVNSFANFKPLEKELLLLRSELSANEKIDKKKLESSLNQMKLKAMEIENKIAKNDITGDLDNLLKTYIQKDKSDEINSKEVSLFLEHIVEDVAMFKKMGID